jgi:hypothetical protein
MGGQVVQSLPRVPVLQEIPDLQIFVKVHRTGRHPVRAGTSGSSGKIYDVP